MTSPWPIRIAWAAAALLMAPGLAIALDDASAPVQAVAAILCWSVWGIVLASTVVPRTAGLTVVRIGGTAATMAGVLALVREPEAATAVAAATGIVVLGVALLPGTGETFVDGSGYGDERRLPLRPPLGLALLPIPLTAVVVVSGLAAPPLLLAAESWVAGIVLAVVAWPLAWLGANRLHRIAERFVVFVPAGVVVHDQLTLADPVLVPRRLVRHVALGEDGSSAADLTAKAAGLTLELELTDPIEIGRPQRGGPPTAESVTALRIAPTRPGRALALMVDRRFPV